MNGDFESLQRSSRFLPTVIAIIVASAGALAWEWRHAHTAAPKPEPVRFEHHDLPPPASGSVAEPSSFASRSPRSGT